jgi:hypothetical protein
MRAAALAIALAAAIPVIALADSPVADLGSVLAPTPAADYVEATPDATILDGPFTAQEYADFINANGLNGNGVVAAFAVYGFKRGYAGTWVERGRQRVLVERVFEFSAGSGAHSFFGNNKLGAQTSKIYTGDIDTSAVPKSFGVRADEKGTSEFIALFEKGNDVYEVLMASQTEDLTPELQAQLLAQYRFAPDQTIPKSQWTSSFTAGVSNSPAFVTGAILAGVVILALMLGVVVLVIALVRRGSRAQPVPIGLSLSPDGAYWWDGTQWRDATLEAPPGAHRSPDGAFWWDGQAWRALPAPRFPG